MQKAIIYARVSSDRQEKEGFSIPAQIAFLKEYAIRHSIIVDKIFSESETAKKAGRKAFNEMLLYIKQKGIKTILVEKTDRLYRNFKDYITLEDYDLEVHLVKESTIISKNSKSHDKFIHGIKVLMAKNYIDNLSEEVRKGIAEKIRQGHYPNKPPIGYKNIKSDCGKNIISIDEKKAPYIKRIFELYASGESIDKIKKIVTEEGLMNNNKPYAKSCIADCLHNCFYIGKFVYNGVIHQGVHEPIISLELFNKVQKMFECAKPRAKELDFAYTGLIKCGYCGCQLTAELKKGKYVYYHCTGNKGGKCKKDYIREENLDKVFIELMQKIADAIPDTILDDIKKALKEMQQLKNEYDDNSQEHILKQINVLKRRIDGLYSDKLDGKISEEFWQEKNTQWHKEKDTLLNKLQSLNNTSKNFYECSNLLLDFSKQAPTLFLKANSTRKRQILNLTCSNFFYKDGELSVELKRVFDYLVKNSSCSQELAQADNVRTYINNLIPLLTSDLAEELKLIA